MSRIPPIEVEGLTELQSRIALQLGETRGDGGPRVAGPWGALLRIPKVCERAAALGTMLRDDTSLPTRLSELAIALAARHWNAQWEWRSHAPKGLKAGLSPDILEAIRLRQRPRFVRHDEELVYNFITELLERKRVTDATYLALIGEITINGVIELIAITGFYCLIAMLIVGLDITLPEGVQPPLPD